LQEQVFINDIPQEAYGLVSSSQISSKIS